MNSVQPGEVVQEPNSGFGDKEQTAPDVNPYHRLLAYFEKYNSTDREAAEKFQKTTDWLRGFFDVLNEEQKRNLFVSIVCNGREHQDEVFNIPNEKLTRTMFERLILARMVTSYGYDFVCGEKNIAVSGNFDPLSQLTQRNIMQQMQQYPGLTGHAVGNKRKSLIRTNCAVAALFVLKTLIELFLFDEEIANREISQRFD